MKSLLLSLIFLLASQVCGQVPTADPPLQVLSQQGPNLSAWVLAPIDRSIPDAIRQNITFLREDLLDEGKTKPQASLEAYRVAYQFCSSLIAALDEREKMLLKAGYRAVQANVITPATNQALEARRNYLMSWPQYEREVQQRNELLRVAEATDRRKVELVLQELKIEWSKRTEPLRANLDTLYVKFRATLREITANTKTFDDSIGIMPARPPSQATSIPLPGTTPSVQIGSKDSFTNSLGMKFVTIPGTNIMMCIHETRNADYALYAKAQIGVNLKWHEHAKVGKENHPVVDVNWKDAEGFCRWLSTKEGMTYRLPTDAEWSAAVGLRGEIGTTPAEKSENGPKNVFPWGEYYPPKPRDGNYDNKVSGDEYEYTAPVMSFGANELGLYDLGGNVWELCHDWYDDSEEKRRVMRGGSRLLYGESNYLLSCWRASDFAVTRGISRGFRCVLEQ